MKKISILFLSLLLLGCSYEWNLNNNDVIKNEKSGIEVREELIKEENNFEIVEVLDVPCDVDIDCKTPGIYMIQSHCPYNSKCIESKCSVICPHPFSGKKITDDNIDSSITEETLQINKNTRIYFKTNRLSSWYCNWWEMYIKYLDDDIVKKIFNHEKYCILDFELISKEKVDVSICYGDGWWSGECVFVNMIYSIIDNTWSFWGMWWYYSPENIKRYKLDKWKIIDKSLSDFKKYFNETYKIN